MQDSVFLSLASSPFVDWVVIISAALYVFLAARGDIWCWLAGFTTSLLSCFVFLIHFDLSQLFLNCYYLFVAVYGWIKWMEPPLEGETSAFVYWSVKKHISCFASIGLLTIAFALLVPDWFSQGNMIVGAFLTALSLVASLLTVYRVISSWLYWIAANLIGVALYWQGSLDITVSMFGLYALLSVYGFIQWTTLRTIDVESSPETQS